MEKKSQQQGKYFIQVIGTFEFSNDDEILEACSQSIDFYNKRMLDLPINIYKSCHKMCYKKYVTYINKIKNIPINEYWNNLVECI